MIKLTNGGANKLLLRRFLGSAYSPIKLTFAIGLMCASACSVRAIAWGAYGRGPWGYPGTVDQQMTVMNEMGVTLYHIDIFNVSQFADFQATVTAAKKHGLKIVPVLQPGEDIFNVRDETEFSAYIKARSFAEQVVAQFKSDIHVWEMGSENEQWTMVQPGETMDDGSVWDARWGDSAGDDYNYYVASRYNVIRGYLRGLCDGAHAADVNAKCIVNTAGWFHYAFLQRLTSDGVAFDITGYHWYSHMGDIENAAPDQNGVGTNIAEILAGLGRPIWITESNRWTGTFDGDEQAQADILVAWVKQLTRVASKYKIGAVIFYQLSDEPYLGLDSFEAYMGLVNAQKDPATGNWLLGRRKVAFWAIKDLILPQTLAAQKKLKKK